MLKTNADVVSVIIGLPNIFYILKVSSVPVGMVLNKNDDTSNSYPDIVQGGELSIKLAYSRFLINMLDLSPISAFS